MSLKIDPLPAPHPAQEIILRDPARFRVVACGRRFGKTELGKIAVLEEAAHGAACWWLAPTYGMAGDVWRTLKQAVMGMNGIEINNTDRRIGLASGGMIAVRSTHLRDNLRGAGLDFAVLDEAAFMADEVWPEVVRPMLLERHGKALFLSTPYGRNWFWEIYQLGHDPLETEWASFHFTSRDNPIVTPAELDAIRRQTPERVFREEYLAEFIDDAGQVFRGIQQAATAPTNAVPAVNGRYVMGVDWGKDGDYTVLAVIDTVKAQMVALDRFNKIGWHFQRERLHTLYNRWKPTIIWAEANSMGSVNIEELQREGLPVRGFMTTTRSKAPLIEGLSLAIERADLRLLHDPVLLGELTAYRLERLPGGGFRYSAPPGGHDDTVIATALAWHGVAQGALNIDFV